MGGLNVGPTEPQYNKQDLEKAYSSLLNDLNEAYWAAGDLQTKDKLYGYIEAITEILANIDATDLENRDAGYSSLLQQVSSVNKELQSLQGQINTIISRINIAATIVSDVTKVVTIATKVFG